MEQISKKEFLELYKDFVKVEAQVIKPEKWKQLKHDLKTLSVEHQVPLPIFAAAFRTAKIAHREISLGHHAIEAIILYATAYKSSLSLDYVNDKYGKTTATLVDGLTKVYNLYDRHVAIETENFRKLLLSFAQDVRVIMIMIVERLDTMRHLQSYDKEQQEEIAREVSYLYAPLAHRMGLYTIKTELEDLSLKYTSYDIYKEIAHKLNETKRSRDAYISKFIAPVREHLVKDGLSFEIKGRTKSIYSIWNKIRKQQVPFEKVYDLFAIRVIIDCDLEQEKAACWQAFSVVTDMYTANTNRLRDWISMPKNNGYESLHITVMGPEGKWVEVQIRTKRMDEIAEKGVAAHWKYKGGKSDSAGTDEWLKNLRDLLENSSDSTMEVIDEFKMQLYDDEVFVFTPKGDLHRLHKGASILDFAFNIHTKVGNSCVGAIVNTKHVPIKYELQNGDQVEILTSQQQSPKADWLNWVCTSKARTCIKQALKEAEHREAEIGRETLLRRLKNWKIEYDDADINHCIKKMGYKTLSEFFVAVAQERVNLLTLRAMLTDDAEAIPEPCNTRTADGYCQETELQKISTNSNALIIDNSLKNVDYTLAKCCNPIYGDEIFGFVPINGGIKIHRKNCPNAPQMIERYGYRIIKAEWAGTSTANEYGATLLIVGHDDIGIVTNISSLIGKEKGVNMRSISINSHDGLFEGNITISLHDINQLKSIIKKLRTIKGVKQVSRI